MIRDLNSQSYQNKRLYMLEILSLLCLFAGLILLIILSIIDLRTFLLPNIYVFPFALLGIIFHLSTHFYYLDWQTMILGGMAGYGVLWLIRLAGNKYYGQESLGLGDVKLLGAAGLWLGVENVLFAMTLGAAAGLIHGIIYAIMLKLKTKEPFNMRRLMIPAGPGFAVGIVLVAGWMYKSHVMTIIYELLS
jgi:prepilin signal peptidase PulO-like enzyme (type II secretory pathway)